MKTAGIALLCASCKTNRSVAKEDKRRLELLALEERLLGDSVDQLEINVDKFTGVVQIMTPQRELLGPEQGDHSYARFIYVAPASYWMVFYRKGSLDWSRNNETHILLGADNRLSWSHQALTGFEVIPGLLEPQVFEELHLSVSENLEIFLDLYEQSKSGDWVELPIRVGTVEFRITRKYLRDLGALVIKASEQRRS